jgi:membrane protease YdiL (CAAX protease family)
LLHRPWPFEKLLRNLTILLILVYGGFFLLWLGARIQAGSGAALDNSTTRMLIGVLSFQGTSLVLIHFFLREHRGTWREAFGMLNRPGRALMLGIAVAISAVPIGAGLQMFSGLLMDYLNVPLKEQEAISTLRASAGGLDRLVLGVYAIVLAPVAEELVFRGIMYPAIKQAGYPRLAVWLTAILFGAIHVNLATFIPLTVFALVLIWLYERTDNLLAPITAHSLFNTVNFVLLFAADSVFKMPGQK